MKKTSNIFTIVLSAIAFGVFFIPQAQASTGAIYSDNFNTFTSGWNQIGSFGHLDAISGSDCVGGTGGCARYPGGPTLKASWRTGATITDPSFQVFMRVTAGSAMTIRVCGSSSSCNANGTTDFQFVPSVPADDSWHRIVVQTKHETGTVWYRYKVATVDLGNGVGEYGNWTDTGFNIASFDSLGFLHQQSAGQVVYVDTVAPPPIEFGNPTTHIIAQNYPTPGVTTPDAEVTFDYDFLNTGLDSPVYAFAGIEVINMTKGITYDTSEAEVAISSSGEISYTNAVTIIDTGDAFQWRPYLRTASSTAFIRGDWYSFSVLVQNPVASPYSPIEGGFGTSTASDFCDENLPYDDSDIIQATLTFIPNGICKAVSFMVVPSQASVNTFQSWGQTIQTKIPFSYGIEMYNIFNDINTAISSSSTTNFPVLELEYGSTTGSSFHGSVVLFSSTTVNALFPEAVRNGFRNLLSVVLWLSFAGYMLLLVKKLTMPVDLS